MFLRPAVEETSIFRHRIASNAARGSMRGGRGARKEALGRARAHRGGGGINPSEGESELEKERGSKLPEKIQFGKIGGNGKAAGYEASIKERGNRNSGGKGTTH